MTGFRDKYANWRSLRTVCLTFDIDFAPDYMIDHLLGILEPHGIHATFFTTHASEAVSRIARNPRYEVGLHPNLSPGSTQGDSLDSIVGGLRSQFPSAIGNRFHLLNSSYRDLAELGRRGFSYDASTLRFNASYLLPALHRDIGLTLLTYFWEDGICESAGLPMTVDSINLGSPGMKIFNFHPLNVYLDDADPAIRLGFLRENPDLTNCPQETAERYRGSGNGAGTLLGHLLLLLSASRCRTVSTSELDTAYRRSLAREEAGPESDPGADPQTDLVSDFHRRTDPAALVTVNSMAEAERRRIELCRYLWNTDGPPLHRQYDEITTDVTTNRFAQMKDLSGIDRLTLRMDFSVESVAYLLRPSEPNGRAVVYHHGHSHGTDVDTIQALLSDGCTVLALWMPLMGPNPAGLEVESARFGLLRLDTHDDLKLLGPSLPGSPLHYFLEPVVTGVNHLRQLSADTPIDMVGLSGGGWTTTLCAALDPRIRRSCPVAGTLPIWLRVTTPDWPSGDYEENEAGLYGIADYLDLYLLGSLGEGRSQLQVLNRYDSCCFAGMRHTLYEDFLSDHLSRLGPGSFRVYLDESHRSHLLSPAALAKVVEHLAQAETP